MKEEVVNTAEPIKAVSESGKYSLNIENTNSIQDDPEVKKQASIIGTIPGVVIYAFIGQTGFFFKAAGIVIVAGAIGGYLFVDKSITVKTLIICGCTTLMATFVATYFSYVAYAMNIDDEGFIFNCLAMLLAIATNFGAYLFDIFKGLILELLGGVAIYSMYMKARYR